MLRQIQQVFILGFQLIKALAHLCKLGLKLVDLALEVPFALPCYFFFCMPLDIIMGIEPVILAEDELLC